MSAERDAFTWEDLGDIEAGRPNLGGTTSVIAFRLFHFATRFVLEEKLGVGETDRLLRRAGHLAGREFAATQLDRGCDLTAYLEAVQRKMAELRIGVLNVEKENMERMELTLTISEDLDCSGVPVQGRTICTFDEGFIAGIFERYADLEFAVKEIDCWAAGAKLCRFTIRPVRR